MRIVSWNVAKRRDCEAQAVAITAIRPDIVVLQELNPRTWPRHQQQLASAGLVYAMSAPDLAPRGQRRRLACFVAIASRWPLARARRARIPAPDAIACVTVDSPFGDFDLVGVHIPTYGGADPLLKIETQEGLLARLKRCRTPTLVCGDFNSPLAELADGTVVPFFRKRGSRQCDAESALMGATNAHGLVDLFRHCHGYGIEAHSWYWKNRGRTGGYRLDHIFASREFSARSCGYIDDWRARGLSDHAPIYADVTLLATSPRSGCRPPS